MRLTHTLLLLFISLLLAGCGDVLGTGSTDLTGTWIGTITYPEHDGIIESFEGMQMNLSQDGSEVSGPVRWTGYKVVDVRTGIVDESTMQDFPIAGTVSGKSVRFTITGGEVMGAIIIKATVSGSTMRGTVAQTVSPNVVLHGTFSATK